MKKSVSICIVLAMVLSLCGIIPTSTQAASDYEYAWFPAPRVYITQLAYESYSHGSQNAIDMAPGGDVFAPFTGKIVYLDSRWGYAVLQSTDKVYYADGTLDYMTVAFMHDENISNLWVGQVISQGTAFYQAGGMGSGNPDAYADHVHLSVHRGLVNGVSSAGKYGAGNVYAFDAFYVNSARTPSIQKEGVMASGNYMTNGAPSNWGGRWKNLDDAVCFHDYSGAVTTQPSCAADGIKTYTCSKCGDSYTETIPATGAHSYGAWKTVTEPGCVTEGLQRQACACGATQTRETSALGHDCAAYVIPATCVEPEFIHYECRRCTLIYNEYGGKWSEFAPSGASIDRLEIKTQYRYRSIYYVIEYTNWGEWSSWQDAAVSDTELTDAEEQVLYPYYYFYCKQCGESARWFSYGGNCGSCGTTIESSSGTVVWLQIPWTEAVPYRPFGSDTGKYAIEYDGWTYWKWTDGTPKTQYRYRTRSSQRVLTYGNWSEWEDSIDLQSSEYEVESRTLYRYVCEGLTDCSWDDGVITTQPTCTNTGVKTYTCTVCGGTRTESIAATGHNYQSGYCTECSAEDPEYNFVTAKVQVGTVSGKTGETVTVPVSIADNPGIAGFTFVFDYDTSAMTLTGISKGAVLQDGSFTPNVAGKTLNWFNAVNVTENGVLFNLTFKLSAVEGSYGVTATLKDGKTTNFVNENAKAQKVKFTEGKVNVQAPVTLQAIEVITGLAEATYYAGDTLNATGLTLKLTYSDGSSEITTNWDAILYDFRTAGLKPVTVVYEGKEAIVYITVLPAGTCGQNLTWKLDANGTLTISGTGAMTDWAAGAAPWNAYKADIKKLVISEGVTSIGENAFNGCTAMQSATIPNSLKASGLDAFKDCNALTAVHIRDIGAWCGISFNRGNSNPVYKAKKLYVNNVLLTAAVIPEGTTSIANFAFIGCTDIKSVQLPKSLQVIGTGSFNGCTGLTSVTIPEGVTEIGLDAFYNCTYLTEINYNAVSVADLSENNYSFGKAGTKSTGITLTIDAKVQRVPAYLFCPATSATHSPKLTTVKFEKDSVCNTIRTNAFHNCLTITDVYYAGTQKQWTQIAIESNNEPLKNATLHTVEPEVDGNAPQIVVSEVEAMAGDTVTVTVSLKNNPGFSGLNAYLTYAEELTLLEAENATSLTFTNDKTMVWDGVTDYTEDGALLRLTFRVSDTAEAGDYFVKINFIEAYTAELDDVTFATVDGAVQVLDFVYGDANGDGIVNTKDIILIRRHVAAKDPVTGQSTVAVKTGADANGDGVVNTKDIILVRRHVAAKDPVTGESTVVLGPTK